MSMMEFCAVTFKLGDQDGLAIKNASAPLNEYVVGSITYRDPSGGIPDFTDAVGPFSGVADYGTNGNGDYVDEPVGANISFLQGVVLINKADCRSTFSVVHNYPEVVGPDGAQYPMSMLQNQTVVQECLYTGSVISPVTTVSVSP